MAIPQTGSRRIVVDGRTFRWRISRDRPSRAYLQLLYGGRGGGLVTVQLDAEDVSVLIVSGLGGPQVTPKDVAAAIRLASTKGWKPDVRGKRFVVEIPDPIAA